MASAKELFAALDAESARVGRKLTRAEAIETSQKWLDSHKPKKKDTPVSRMDDKEFMDYLVATYDWLDVAREITKCRVWTMSKIQGSSGPSRRRIINWLNKTTGDRPVGKSQKGPAVDITEIPSFDWARVIQLIWPRDEHPHRVAWEEEPWNLVPSNIRYRIITEGPAALERA